MTPVCMLSHVRLLPPHGLHAAHQAPLSVEFFRQEYWSGLPFLIPRDLHDPGSKCVPLMSPLLARGFLPMSHLGSPVYMTALAN